MNPIIKVENISKLYRIGAKQSAYKTFRESIVDAITAPVKNFRRLRNLTKFEEGGSNQPDDTIWALKDVSFEVQPGEVVGIIGGNGAGKSTLLKILSRITEPTSGRVELHGRVASLLEVGTGFHPELTGRENIFLNGAILGMRKTEIENKFDEIVDFAEIEKFLDTPVKFYSSGMYVRLAFAVAAHLEPEILLVDEVLAVGDAQFQKKCLGKMGDVAKEGRTVLFVSHQMGTIAQFCNRAYLFDDGQLVQYGTTQNVLYYYYNLLSYTNSGFSTKPTNHDSKDIFIVKAQTYNEEGLATTNFLHNEKVRVFIHCKINRWVYGSEVRISVRDSKRNVFTSDTELLVKDNVIPKEICAKVSIPACILRPEKYYLTLATYLPNQVIFDIAHDALTISIFDGGSKYAASEGLDYGCVFVNCDWTIE